MLTYTKATRLDLRSHGQFNEAWLQDRIAEDPSILGLGDVNLIERERIQAKAGRLDLLLSDAEGRRFEVELMLGPTDPSHIIRTIEYWDIERRRYPAYDHVAVLVAEDITSRFLNVLGLFSGSIPLIAIQLNALQVGEGLVLNFTRVLDQTELRSDDKEEASAVEPRDRNYWENKSSGELMRLGDRIVDMIRETARMPYAMNYTRGFVGLTDGARARNFVLFVPRYKHLKVKVVVSESEKWRTELEAAGVEADLDRQGRLWVVLNSADLGESEPLIRRLLRAAVAEYEE